MTRTIVLACAAAGMVFGQAPATPQPAPAPGSQAVPVQPSPAQPAPAPAPAHASAPAPAAEPARQPLQPGQVQTVYLLPMRFGMDQYLAEQLVKLGVYQVTADPQRADALFSDRLGSSFEARLNALYPPPEVPQEPAATEEEEKARQKDEDAKRKAKEQQEMLALRSTWGGGKGNVFLVDRHARTVIWSTYQPPKNSSAGEVNKAAGKIASTLAKQLKGQ